jgi:hypothetical protein
MGLISIEGGAAQPAAGRSGDSLVAHCLAAAAQGDTSACYDLGVAFSTGSPGGACELMEAR